MFDKECTGDLDAVIKYLNTIEGSNDNWIKGRKGKFKICAKVFREGSDFGINNGRISKLQVCDVSQEHWGFEQCYVNYDRGWDIRPNDPEAIEFLNGLLAAFGDEPMNPDDLIYYSLYLYASEEEFEARCNRDHAGDFDTVEDARNEGKWYLTSDDQIGRPCAVFKVISSDDEEIEVVRREVASDGDRIAAFAKELGELSTKHQVVIEGGNIKVIEK